MPSVCSAPGCGRASIAQDLCSAHYKRKQRGGDVSAPVLGPHGRVRPDGELVPLTTKILRASDKALKSEAKRRHISRYELAAEILDSWAAARQK